MKEKLLALKKRIRLFNLVPYSKKKLIGSIAGVLFVIASLSTGLYLVQTRQNTGVGAGGAELSLSTSNSNPKVGDNFVVAVYLDTKGLNVSGADIKVGYDTKIVEATSIQTENFLPTVLTQGKVSSNIASIVVGCLVDTSGAHPKSGAGVLAQINFKAKSSGSANISFASGTAVAAIGQQSNVAGTQKAVQIKVAGGATAAIAPTQTPTPSGTAKKKATTAPTSTPTQTSTPTATPTESTESSIMPQINSVRMETNFSPWYVIINGTNLTYGVKVRLIDVDGGQWGDDLSIKGIDSSGMNTSVQLPANSPPSKCNNSGTCTITIYLVTPTGVLSNQFSFDLPAVNPNSGLFDILMTFFENVRLSLARISASLQK